MKAKFSRRRIGTIAKVLALSALLNSPMQRVLADDYPSKPVRLVLGLAPGGMNDIVARLVSGRLGESIGQSVIVENRTGAGGTLGAAYAAKSPPDGYTIFLGAISNMAIATAQYKNLQYHPVTDFAPITQLASATNILVANPASPYRSVADVIAAARNQPGQLPYATAGMGTSPHMAGELFNLMAGVKLANVPYKGDGPALIDVVGGQVPLAFPALPASMTFIKSAKLRAIAVTSRQRSRMLPDVPTIAESGVLGYDMSAWVGLFAPAGTPSQIVDKLNKELVIILKTQAVQERFTELGLEAVGDSPAEFGRFLKSEIEKWGNVAKAAGIVPN